MAAAFPTPFSARDVTDSLSSDEVAKLRVPPHSIEAEQSVLGGLLLDNSAWDRASDLLHDGDFRSDSLSSDEVAKLRVPPHSIEAEQSVLGGLLLDNSAWDRASDLLHDGDFYRHEHQLIFKAIEQLVSASKPADVITVFEQLQMQGKGAEVGGLGYLNALAQSVPSAANMRRYAEIVRERAVLRKLVTAS